MSRQKDNSLKYFPLDVGFFGDKRIRRLAAQFGGDGPLLYVYILCAAYGGEGYYVVADDDFIEDAATDLHCSTEKIGLMLRYLLNKSLLDSTLFDTVKVLTSHGIQAQYQESVKGLRRDIEVRGDLWLLDKSESLGFIKVRLNADKSGINADKSGKKADKSGINAANKIKENKTKIKEIDAPQSAAPTQYEIVMNLYNDICRSYPKCTIMSNERKKAIQARVSSGFSLDDFRALFQKAEASAFLRGANNRNWRASFDWLIADKNMAKVLDGNYDEKPKGKPLEPTRGNFGTDDDAKLAAYLQKLKEGD